MGLPFDDLLRRLDGLPALCRDLREGFEQAVAIAGQDPEMALTRARKTLEFVVRDVYQRRCGTPAGTQPLENLLQRLEKDGHLPRREAAYADAVRELGNVGTHAFGERLTADDVYESLRQLLPILEWYCQGGPSGQPQPAPAAPPPGRVTLLAAGLAGPCGGRGGPAAGPGHPPGVARPPRGGPDPDQPGPPLPGPGAVGRGRGRLPESPGPLPGTGGPLSERGTDAQEPGRGLPRPGRLAEAKDAFEKALDIVREFGDHRHEGLVLESLALLREAQHDLPGAAALERQALAALEQTEDEAVKARARALLARWEAGAK